MNQFTPIDLKSSLVVPWNEIAVDPETKELLERIESFNPARTNNTLKSHFNDGIPLQGAQDLLTKGFKYYEDTRNAAADIGFLAHSLMEHLPENARFGFAAFAIRKFCEHYPRSKKNKTFMTLDDQRVEERREIQWLPSKLLQEIPETNKTKFAKFAFKYFLQNHPDKIEDAQSLAQAFISLIPNPGSCDFAKFSLQEFMNAPTTKYEESKTFHQAMKNAIHNKIGPAAIQIPELEALMVPNVA